VAGRAARQIVRDIAGLRWKRALMRFTQSGLSFGEWLRYARRPRYMTPQ
jgi:hypothetical protein